MRLFDWLSSGFQQAASAADSALDTLATPGATTAPTTTTHNQLRAALAARAGDCDTAPTALSALNPCDTVMISDSIQASSTLVNINDRAYIVIPLVGVPASNVPAALLLRPIDQLVGGQVTITHADGRWQTQGHDILIKAASPDHPLGKGLYFDAGAGRLCFSETTPAAGDLDRAHVLDVSELQANTTVDLAELTTTMIEAQSTTVGGFASRISGDTNGNTIFTHDAWSGFTYVSKDGWVAHYQSTDPQPGGVNMGGSEATLLPDGRIAVPSEHDVVIFDAPTAAGSYTFNTATTTHITIHADDAASRRAYSVSTLGQVRGDTGPVIAVTAGESGTGKTTTYLIDSRQLTGDIDLTTLTPGDGTLIYKVEHGRNPNFDARPATSVGSYHWAYTKADTPSGGEICLVQHANGTVTADVCIDFADNSIRDAQLVSNGTDTWLLITASNGQLTLLSGEYLAAYVPAAFIDHVSTVVNQTIVPLVNDTHTAQPPTTNTTTPKPEQPQHNTTTPDTSKPTAAADTASAETFTTAVTTTIADNAAFAAGAGAAVAFGVCCLVLARCAQNRSNRAVLGETWDPESGSNGATTELSKIAGTPVQPKPAAPAPAQLEDVVEAAASIGGAGMSQVGTGTETYNAEFMASAFGAPTGAGMMMDPAAAAWLIAANGGITPQIFTPAPGPGYAAPSPAQVYAQQHRSAPGAAAPAGTQGETVWDGTFASQLPGDSVLGGATTGDGTFGALPAATDVERADEEVADLESDAGMRMRLGSETLNAGPGG